MLVRSIIIVLAILMGACNPKDKSLYNSTPVAIEIPVGWPPPVYDFSANPLTKEGIALGRKLFYDGILSQDGNFPCASCHQQEAAFGTFAHDLSHGFNDQHTLRNAPSLQNLAWYASFHADGGITHLDLQSLFPITAPNEMAETIDGVLFKLKADPSYPILFERAFGTVGITTNTLTRALSQFLLSLVSHQSKYDLVMAGKASFNQAEQLGLEIFRQKCAACHAEPLFTDLSFRNIGLPKNLALNDLGRMRVTHLPADSLKFKVPSLRNIMVSGYYGHDGRFFDIENVLDHYTGKVQKSATTDPLVINNIPLSKFERGQLVAFMQTLTDTQFLKNKNFSAP